MKLFIVGKLEGYITEAGKIAMSRGAKVFHCDSIDSALHALRAGKSCDLLMIDVKCDIKKFITSLTTERFNVTVVACGIGSDADAAVAAIKAGAKEYIPLPPDADLIAAVLEAVAEENNEIIAKDPGFLDILKLAEQIAPSDASILITGESGTGKEVLAKFIHNKSKRHDKPFVSINCAAIPENLLESELFGHEKGAFTGAVAQRIGKFEEASGGTLLLDEISEMHPSLQAKLLRAIQEKEIDRVGSTKPIKVDIRILATSNRNLTEEVKHKRFREDLFFRLNVVNIKLPALRNRQLDIDNLARHFTEKFSRLNGFNQKVLAQSALKKLHTYDWPGNVRELENTIHRAVLLSPENLIEENSIMLSSNPLQLDSDAEDAQKALAALHNVTNLKDPAFTNPQNSDDAQYVGRTVADVEEELIIDTLKHCFGNRTHAATILGISIRTLRNKLKLYSEKGKQIP